MPISSCSCKNVTGKQIDKVNGASAKDGINQSLLKGFEKRCIALNDRYRSYLAVKHLIQNGHTKIGYLCSNHEISDSSDRLQRLQRYIKRTQHRG